MRGTNAKTGKALSGIDHLRQSVRDILLTPLGSRVMRRDYGSRLLELIDAPMNRKTLLDIYAGTVDAINKWEPRLAVDSVKATKVEPGIIELTINGKYLGDEIEIIVGNPPVINSALLLQVDLRDAISYQITATGAPTSFYLLGGLPSGLSFNSAIGVISGIVSFTESFAVKIGAVNAAGYDERLLFIESISSMNIDVWAFDDAYIAEQADVQRISGRPFSAFTVT